MPTRILAHKLLLPELELTAVTWRHHHAQLHLFADKQSEAEVCPRCATLCRNVYDHREVSVRDAPIRGKQIVLHIRKRRFSCRTCRRPFTEPVPGIRKGSRTTQRYKASLLWACEHFSDLKAVRRTYRCSGGYLYKALYDELERKRTQRLYPWPKTIGIDEHFFKRNKRLGFREFVSVIVDFKGKRVMEVVEGRQAVQLEEALAYIPGRENVRFVVLDMCDPFKNFAKSFFPNAMLIADKFHVLRLLNPALNRRREEITGDRRSLPIRRLLLRSGKKLDHVRRSMLHQWLKKHPELCEVYTYKEALHRLYRIRGLKRAQRAFAALTDAMAHSALPEIQSLRKTLLKWRHEILAYFYARLTNGRTEGFNGKAKLVKRRGYGYRNFNNYRLRLLHACA